MRPKRCAFGRRFAYNLIKKIDREEINAPYTFISCHNVRSK